MADVFFQPTLTPSEKRTDLLTAAIINSAIDMEATLGSVYAIAYMLRHNIDMELSLRVVLNQAERRMTFAWQASEPDEFDVCCTAPKFERHRNAESNTSVWHRK